MLRASAFKGLAAVAVAVTLAAAQTPDTRWYTADPDAAGFIISTADELAGLAQLVNNRSGNFEGKTIILANDIDLSVHYGESYNDGKGWIPIGWQVSDFFGPYYNFNGIFEGNGKKISGLYINNVGREEVGLFGNSVGIIRNLSITNVDIHGGSFVGGVVGKFWGGADGTVANCYVTGTISSTSSGTAGKELRLGGVVGEVTGDGIVTNCYFAGTVSNTGDNGFIGGVAGALFNGTVANCYSAGTVSGKHLVGGIVGQGRVANCYSISAVIGSGGVTSGGNVINSAALNPSVTGQYRLGSSGSNNVAFSNMVNSEGTTTWNYKGADNIDGADITAIEIYTDGTIGGRFTTENGWKIENGKLPGLDAPVDMPDHLSPFVNAKIPTISAQPKNATIGLGTTGATYDLAVIASVIDSGVLSYQWYTNTTASNTGGTAIAGATSATYTASINTDAEKKFYYYVIITNKINDNGDGGRKTSTVASNIATVTVTRINAQVPTIVTQPASAEVPKGAAGSVRNLTVETSVNDGGTLSYQWYVNTTASNTDGIAIEGATKQNYNAPIDKEIVFYYYVVITNSITDNGDGGQKTAIVSSSPARLAVIVTNAQSPVITVHPASVQLPLGETGAVRSLAVAANVAGGGTLSYQWYANTTASNIGGEMIDGATGMVYAAPVDIEGTFYYYVVVTNNITDNGDGGRKSAAAASNVAILGIGVSAINAQVPAITAQPANATVAVGTTRNLTVAASVADDGILRYQWYTNTVASNSGGTKIDGATSATYTALINAEETFYYYVIVTNTINDNGDGGQKTVTTISNVAALKGTLGVSVQSRDRIIPVVNPNAEATVVAPVNQLTAEFTAGPNPVNRNCGVVNFYRQGKRIDSGTLTIYDASGNVIRKIAIRDDDATAGTRRAVSLQSSEHPNIQSRRPVGTWDLVDRRGRLVSDGTYLVKGVVVASDGKKERVSLKVGVR